MNGSVEEDTKLKQDLVAKGVLIPLQKYDTCFLARTDPRDVARVESRTVISTPTRIETIPETPEGIQGQLGYWMSPDDLDDKVHTLFPGSMKGRHKNLISNLAFTQTLTVHYYVLVDLTIGLSTKIYR